MRIETFRRLNWTLVTLLAGWAVGCTQTKMGSTTKPADQTPMSAQGKSDNTAGYTQITGGDGMPHQPQAAMQNDITGSWKWSVDAQGTPINHSAKFKQSGQTLTGTWTDSYGDQPVTADIKEGTVKDGQVNFKVTRPSPFGDGSEMSLTFNGKLDPSKDKIDGTINVVIPGSDPIPSEWHAMKVKE